MEFFGWFEDRSSIFIAMEYCRYGDLHHYLVRQPVVAVNEVQQLSFQILEAVDQMHQHDFAHRDLKPGVRMMLSLSKYLLMNIRIFLSNRCRQTGTGGSYWPTLVLANGPTKAADL